MKRARFVVPVILLLLIFPGSIKAQKESPFIWSFAPQVGTDIGAPVPYPFSSMGGDYNPYPKILPSIGARTTFKFRAGWTFAAELTYKTVAMTADARVENQRMKGEAGSTDQYFTGTASIESSYTQLEVPLYLKYMIGRNRSHRVLLGGYYSYILDATFISEAKKGFIGAAPDNPDDVVNPDNPRIMDFSETLSNWDAGIILGYEIGINSRLNLGIRAMVGMKDIFKNDPPFDFKMIPVRGSVLISYDLFEIKAGKGRRLVR
ncbi:MAG: PorT family protein [Bacteroidales bacterium]|nr:PorT family protein [Bacteroidales bacterium]